MKFDMSKVQNSASFLDKTTKIFLVVDSFDNETFHVRIGSIYKTNHHSDIKPEDDAELNALLTKIFDEYKAKNTL